ncbi:MAG: class I SAM-dependent methyltransferase [bacterium]
MKKNLYPSLLVISLLTISCGDNTATPSEQPASQKSAPLIQSSAELAASAVANPDRPEADREQDAARKPQEMLEFFQMAPGMTVFEMEAGTGWYTELMAFIIGPQGKLTMQNPDGFKQFPNFETNVAERLSKPYMANVTVSYSNFDQLEAPTDSVDLVTWVWGPHELYFKPDGEQSLGDPQATFAEINRILKPTGRLVIIDHAAAADAPAETGNSLHRIDPKLVQLLADEAGFEVEAVSTALQNPEDDHSLLIFNPAIRGKTDRFALRFKLAQ